MLTVNCFLSECRFSSSSSLEDILMLRLPRHIQFLQFNLATVKTIRPGLDQS